MLATNQPEKSMQLMQPQQLLQPFSASFFDTHKATNNPIELVSLLIDDTIPWQVHNCKVLKLHCSQTGTLPFLYHYDQLSDALKHANPLTPTLLRQFNTPMTAAQAMALLDVPKNSIATPWFVKLTGSVVVYHEPTQLAIRLHWSNTSKQTDALYCHNKISALKAAMDAWQFIGRVDVLYKQAMTSQTEATQTTAQKNATQLVIYDHAHEPIEYQASSTYHPQMPKQKPTQEMAEQSINISSQINSQVGDKQNNSLQYTIPTTRAYTRIPHTFAVSFVEALNAYQHKLTWIEAVIIKRVF